MDLGGDLAVLDVDPGPRRGRIAVEDVPGRPVVDDQLPAEVPHLGDVGVAAGDDPGIGPAGALDDDVGVELLVEA